LIQIPALLVIVTLADALLDFQLDALDLFVH
jgi:hypothetical protein